MELVSRCVECNLAEPESLASLGGSAPGVVDGILSLETDQRRLLPGGPSSSEGSTVGPMVLSLAILNNLVLTMSSQIGNTLAKRRT